MPLVKKSPIHLVAIFLILLNVTFIKSAVIRREQRSITTNGTVSGISDKEVDPATGRGLEDGGNLLLETISAKDDTTTKSSLQDRVTTSAFFGEDKKEDTTLTGLRLDENTVSLSSDRGQESSKNFVENEEKNETAKSKIEESTTLEMEEDKKEDTTLTGLMLDENTVSLSSDRGQESSKKNEEKNETAKSKIEESTTAEMEETNSKKEESTTEEMKDNSTISKIIETTTITPVIENDRTTSKKEEEDEKEEEEKEEKKFSIASVESSTQLEGDSIDETKNKTNKEEKIQTTVKNFVDTSEDTTRLISTSPEEVENVNATNATTMDANEKTSTEVDTTISVENDSATKTVDSVTNFKLEEVDKVTEQSHVQNELVDASTELVNNDISKIFIRNEHKENLIEEKELTTTTTTTESLISSKTENVEKRKLPDNAFTKLDETTQLPISTEFPDEHVTKTPVHEDFKKTGNDTKQSNSSSTEKRGKFIAHNYSSFNEFQLPNTSDVWALAGLRSVGKAKSSSELQNSVETSEEKPVNNSMATKSLHDWTRVMDSTHDMGSKPSLKLVESTEDPTTETATPITTTTHGIESKTTVKTIDVDTDTTTEMPILQETTEKTLNQDNEVELSTTLKVETEPTTVMAVILTDKIERDTIFDANPTESQTTSKDLETTTEKYEQLEITTIDDSPPKDADEVISTTISSLIALTNRGKKIEENKVDGDSFGKETIPLPMATTTTTITPIPQLVTVKSETTESLVNGEINRKANAGTTFLSTSSSLSDFTTSIPFLTSTDAITKKTMAVMTDVMMMTTTPVILNAGYEVNEPSSTVASKIPTHTTSPSAVTIDSSVATTTTTITTTTTTTTMPAVTVMASVEATTETQTTTEAPHTPAIISNDTMIQKSNNNYNEYEVVNKSTENYTDNSSTEAFEATTRVGLPQSYWSTNAAEITTTEVDKLDDDDLDVTTESSFENNNEYDIESTIKTVIDTVTLAPKTHPIIVTDTAIEGTKISTENLDHIDPIHKISDTAETSIESNVIDPLQVGETSTAATTTTTTTTESNQENMKMHSTERGDDESIYSITTTTTTTAIPLVSTTTTTSTPNYDESATTFESISTKKEDVYSIVPTIDNGGGFHVPKLVFDDSTTTTFMPPGELDNIGGGIGIAGAGVGGGLQPMDSPESQETDVNVIIAISVSTVGIIALILLVAFLYVMRKRQKQMSYGQRCRPVSLDAYSLDNVSVYNSVRRKGATLRASKRSYGNVAFDDPSLRHNVLGTHELARYVEKKSSIWDEFKEVPQIIARADEVPAGCEDKNRYANVIPLPETRVILQQQNGDEKSEYINANYVRGPKDTTNYYIACQAPLETTVNDFWRMIWEQNSRVIIMATDLIENGIDKCAEYLPPSVTLDNHTVFGDYQVTLKHREVKEKYAISTLMLKNTVNDESREITHYWYQWPETGVPTDEAAIIAMLLEARSSLKAYTIEQSDSKIENSNTEDDSSVKSEINGNVTAEKPKAPAKEQGPLTIHCSPGTGRTGTILGCDIAMRCLEEPKRTVDVPQIVYSIRRGRASAVQTKEQYEFIYKVTHMYATKISNINNDN